MYLLYFGGKLSQITYECLALFLFCIIAWNKRQYDLEKITFDILLIPDTTKARCLQLHWSQKIYEKLKEIVLLIKFVSFLLFNPFQHNCDILWVWCCHYIEKKIEVICATSSVIWLAASICMYVIMETLFFAHFGALLKQHLAVCLVSFKD